MTKWCIPDLENYFTDEMPEQTNFNQMNKVAAWPLNSTGTNLHFPHFLQCLHSNLWYYGLPLPDLLPIYSFMSCQITFEKIKNARYLKSQTTSLIACANCHKKSQILKRKSLKAKQFFWRQLPPKKAKFVKFGVKQPVCQPWSWMCPVSNWLCVEVSSVCLKGFERFALLFLVGGFVDRQVTAVVSSLAWNVTLRNILVNTLAVSVWRHSSATALGSTRGSP